MKKTIAIGLIIAALFQLLVLTGMVGLSAMPLWTGKEIKVKTIPVDPRSMFRGNYARLKYNLSEISVEQSSIKIRNGEVVYVSLLETENGLLEFSKASLTKPEAGTFLRGRIQTHRFNTNQKKYNVKYGIEAFFAPKEKALALEKDLRDGSVAVLMISSGGKARIKNIMAGLPLLK
jgi:uncharacterized membrane-anchored protein